MHPSKVSETEKSQLENETLWQYYGTTSTTDNLTVTWEPSALPTRSVTIELWGYEETGKATKGCTARGALWATRAWGLQRWERGDSR